MGTGDLLGVDPDELKFHFELNKQISCSMHLSNKTDDFLAFKVKTTNPKKYCVRPNVGIILPRSTCDVVVTMQAQKETFPDMQCKDKFLLQCVATSSTTTLNDITQEIFSKEPGKIVDELKLQVVYVLPPQQPSVVSEESEESTAPSLFTSNKDNMHTKEFPTASWQQQKEPENKESALMSRLLEEKNSAMQQNNKLRQEVELMRQEMGRRQGGFSLMFVVLVALLGSLIGYLVKK
ncbi:vesicle-associated protein 1-1 isoform X1 [Canna indica]|uniref:Vesicle-associated protein 1-1 isoform X1 n=1 Tax=Canna indica TaxID=4628 RepID=A0AAQ3Q2F0_9LILI|nr:vesicle-associated protein 1-1 isoform X1 [Canna indica]